MCTKNLNQEDDVVFQQNNVYPHDTHSTQHAPQKF